MVSRNPARDRQTPITTAECKPVKMVMVKIETGGGFVVGSSNCGWASKPARRRKVAEDRTQAHLDKRHGGQGLWL